MTNEKIQEIYQQFQQDFCLTGMPELSIERTNRVNPSAAVSNVVNGRVKLFIGTNFEKSMEEYLEAVLYHEFVHIWDDVVFYKDEKDNEKKNILLFPFTEIHGSEIELLKLLKTHTRPKSISKTQKFPFKNKYVTVEEFLKSENDELWLYANHLRNANKVDFFWNAMSKILYNIGYVVVLSNNLDLMDQALNNFSLFDYAQNEIFEICELYLTQKPSENLCSNLTVLINSILGKMIEYSGRSDLFSQ